MEQAVEAKQGTPLAYGAWILGCFLWGSALSVIKFIIDDYEPIFLVFGRMFISFLVLTPLVLIFCKKINFYKKRDFFLIILLSIFDPIGFFSFEAMALKYTSASQAGALWALYPMLCMAAAWLILKERTTLPVIICFIISMLGIMLLTLFGESNDHASNPLLGNFLEFLSLCSAAGAVVIVRFLKGTYSTMFLVWIQSLIAALAIVPFLIINSSLVPETFKIGSVLILIYLAVGVSLFAQTLSFYAIGRLPVAWVATLGNLIPVIGVLTGIIMLGEKLNLMQWSACIIVLGAVLISQHFQRKKDTVKTKEQTEPITN